MHAFRDDGITAAEHPTEPNFWHLGGVHSRRGNRDWIARIQMNGEMHPEEQGELAHAFASAPLLADRVRILREALEGATSDLEDTLSELKLMNPKRQNHNEEARIKRFRTALEATKEGAST